MNGFGCVHLVGSGPGDPELLTLKAARLLARADAVIYDRLVSEAVLDLAPRAAEMIFVGKRCGDHTMTQPRINATLVDAARRHRQVVRLKGGDPFIFGRGGEEALHLAGAGVPYTVVPGVTAAAGCAAALGLPLTHRGLATGLRFVTGHLRENGRLVLDWDGLADPDTTLAIYMGLGSLDEVARQLIAAGLTPDMPALVVEKGTTPGQRHVCAPLAGIAAAAAAGGLVPPCLTLIGRVVGLRDALAIARNAMDLEVA